MNKFGNSVEAPVNALQLFEPDARTLYTLDAVASLTQLPRRVIVFYCKHGLVSTVMDPSCSGWYFNDEAIRILRRIEYLRTAGGFDLTGVKLIVDLVREIEHLREELTIRPQRP